jgi:hypothetical protein
MWQYKRYYAQRVICEVLFFTMIALVAVPVGWFWYKVLRIIGNAMAHLCFGV